MAQRILGLDLGANAVKGVLLESTFRGYTVLDAGRAPLDAEPHPPPPPSRIGEGGARSARYTAVVRALIEARGWRFDAVIVALPGTGARTSSRRCSPRSRPPRWTRAR